MGLRHVFGNRPIPRLLDFLLVHRFWDYPLSELSNATGVSYRTLQSILPGLLKAGLVEETRTVSKAKFYRINLDSSVVRKLDEFAIEMDHQAGLKERPKLALKASATR